MTTIHLPTAYCGAPRSGAAGSVALTERWLWICLALITAAALTALAAPGAHAAVGYERTGAFAQVANDGGVTQTHNGRIAVRVSTGDVYVTDTVDDQVSVYRPNATDADLVTSFGTGTLTDPYGIAIDQSTGDVYVSDAANTKITKYESDGAATPTFTQDAAFSSPGDASALTFDPVADELVYIDPTDQKIKRATPVGTPIGTPFDGSTSGTAFTGLQDLAVTSTGEIIVVDATGDITSYDGTSRVERFDADGSHNGTLGPVETAATVAVVPDGDQILVSGDQNNVWGSGFAKVTVFANDGTPGPTITSSEYASIVTGLAAPGNGDQRIYVASDTSPQFDSCCGDASVQAFESFIYPELTLGSTDAITTTQATFHGTVNPNGPPSTSAYFEYSSDGGGSWTPTPAEDPGTGTAAVPVTASATGLAPAVTYQVRFVAEKAGARVETAAEELTTDSAAPAITGQVSSQIQERSARVAASVTPNGPQTTYHVEYGPTSAYGQRLPVSTETPVGSGTTAIGIRREVTELQPGTTYHYRVVATNAVGTTFGPDATFKTASGNTAGPSPGRHFELATPPEKLGQPTRVNAISPDGNTIKFDTTGGNGLPGTGAHASTYNSYIARRDGRRWEYVPMALPGSQIGHSRYVDATESLDLQLFRGITHPATQATAFFSRQVGGSPVRATPEILSRAPLWVNSLPYYYGASADLTRVVFYAAENDFQNPEIAYLSNDPLPAEDGSSPLKIYEAPGGATTQIRRVDVDNAGVPISSCSSPSLGSVTHLERAISADGHRIFFSARPDCSIPWSPGRQHLYARQGGTSTIELSASECTRSEDSTATPPVTACSSVVGDAQYESASADGERVFFSSPDQLVNQDVDATNDLYRYDFAAPAGDRLTLVSEGDDTDTTPGAGANLQGVVRVSADGSRTYFVAQGVLTTDPNVQNVHATEGRNNLYLADGDTGDITFVATLDDSGDTSLWGYDSRPAQLADQAGRYFVFVTVAPLTADDTDSAQDLYRYDAETGGLLRVSIGHADYETNGNANEAVRIISPAHITSASPSAESASRNVSVDGSRIIFSTAEALQSGDDNGAPDIYEWHDGHVSLVSDGQAPVEIADNNSFLISADGTSVAFSTAFRLLPERDTDTVDDVYVARLGTDVDPPPPAPEGPCVGNDCQGPSGSPLGSLPANSSVFTGPGNVLLPNAAAGEPMKWTIAKPKRATGTSTTLRIKVPGKGRLRIAGSGLRRSAKRTSRAATYRMRARLSPRATRKLKRQRRVNVTARVTFVPVGGTSVTKTVKLTFRSRQKQATKRAGARSVQPSKGVGR